MRAIVLFSKIDRELEKKWWDSLNNNKDENKDEIKECQEAKEIFKQGQPTINYKLKLINSDYICIIDYNTTAFSAGNDKKFHDSLREPAKKLVECIFSNHNIAPEEYLILVHSIELTPSPEYNISNYSIGGNGIARERAGILEGLFKNLTKDNFENCYNELKKNFYKEELVKPLSLLKHRIAHLFLPMDIDLQGIKEVKSQNIEKAIVYLKEALEEKKDNPAYYRQRLADLWYILVKGKMENGKWKIEKERKMENGKLKIDYFKLIPNGAELTTDCVPVPPRKDCESLLAEGKAVIDLLAENGKKIDDSNKQQKVMDLWKELLKHCGLCCDDGNPFDKTKIYPQSSVFNLQSSNSEILQLMCVLDSKIQKYSQNENSISNSDIDEILGSNSSHLKSDISFHRWFCALDECLDKLRGGDERQRGQELED